MKKTALVIGGGIGGLGTACLLAKAGMDVTILEKNEQLGGRAGQFSAEGFTFDMGPSWYLMPDIFEQFYELLGEDVNKHLDLQRLDPSYKIWFRDRDLDPVMIHSDLSRDMKLFEKLDPGITPKLTDYLDKAKYQYSVAKQEFMYKNYKSVKDFMNRRMLVEGAKLNVFSSIKNYISKYTTNREMQQILQYPMVFLGSDPASTPAIYSIMNYIDFELGVYYPQGGIHSIITSLRNIFEKNGGKYQLDTEVMQIIVEDKKAVGVITKDGNQQRADYVISNGDVYHTDTELLPKKYQQYSQRSWDKKTIGPSAFILYLGMDKKYSQLQHHNLVFAKNWEEGFEEIFKKPEWPQDPSYYICAPSVTDPHVAPEGKENLFVLVPMPANLHPTDDALQDYKHKVLDLIAKDMKEPDLKKHIIYEKMFSEKDFRTRYHAMGGTALGLAHTLWQTALWRPRNYHKKVSNLYMVGGGTVPGIGMPICLISAQLVYKHIAGITTPQPLESLDHLS